MSLLLVGPIVGAIGTPASGGSAALPDTGGGYDFAIGGLGFNLAISDERKYERATAQFRKEQFDSSPTVGDTSLTGWWTRGQLTFHHGAGVDYYDVLDETVVNRFNSSIGVNVRTPGKVTLLAEPTVWNTSIVTKFVANKSGRSEDFAGIIDSSDSAALLDPGATTALTTSTPGATVYDVAHGHLRTFFATSGGVDQVPDAGTTLTLAWGNVAADIFGFPVGVWFAKGRLFIVTSSGKWFAKPANTTGTLADADSFWISGLSTTSTGYDWVVADSPGPVYLAFGDTIYAVTPDDTGLVPTLTAGKTVMQLPNDEYVVDMAYGPGHLVISTSKGVRVAAPEATGGLTYGPLLFEGHPMAGPGACVAFQGTVAYVVGDFGSAASYSEVRSIDLSRPIDGEALTFAWATEYTHASSNTGVVVVGDNGFGGGGGRFYLNSSGILSAGEPGGLTALTSGSITTAYHRFGTLEPKKFVNVSVRVAGWGTVGVSKVLADGTEVPLSTIDVRTDIPEFISLDMESPAEMVALKFTLTRDSTVTSLGPELLGYQIRALPAPRRQRMIRVPLLLHDVERKGVTRAKGYTGSAWERLSALEEMESSGGTFTYQDFRTGESGQCYIEQIAHEGNTPPSRQQDGFGGFVFVTLRRL